jgi:hypothetical protein
VKAAYADPPYLGLAKEFYGDRHAQAGDYDRLETHIELINRLSNDFDAWSMSLHTPALRTLLPHCPGDVRVMAWVKPFASFKPGVRVAYAWEPVIVRGAAKGTREQATVRDWHAANITLQRGFSGAKPESFCFWLFEVLGLTAADEFHDLFPGSGAVSRAWDAWRHQPKLPYFNVPTDSQRSLIEEDAA